MGVDLLAPIGDDETPRPADSDEAARWDHTSLRIRLNTGQWQRDLWRRRVEVLGTERATQGGRGDLSCNPHRQFSRALAVLYNSAPEVRHDAGELPDLLGDRGSITESGLWSYMPRFQASVLSAREYLLRIHVTPDGQVRYFPVRPDRVVVAARDDVPDEPAAIAWLRMVEVEGESRWAWDVMDIRGEPSHRIIEAKPKKGRDPADWTARVLGESAGSYPWIADGAPFLPWVLYHAERVGDRLFDPYEGAELAEGTLNIGVLWSFWMHVVAQSSWPQRWGINVQPVGASTNSAGQSEMLADPAVVLFFEQLNESASVQLGQWGAGGDPLELLQSITAYAARLGQEAGFAGTDLQRLSADPRSGLAIALSNESKREAQRKYASSFRWSDQQLIARTAASLNVFAGTSYPTDGYRVRYTEVPLSPDERRSRREHVFELLDRGLITVADAYREINDGISREQALQDLTRIRMERGTANGVRMPTL